MPCPTWHSWALKHGSNSGLVLTGCGQLNSEFFVDLSTIQVTDGGELVLATSDLDCLNATGATVTLTSTLDSCQEVGGQLVSTGSSFAIVFSVEQVTSCGEGSQTITTVLSTTMIVLVSVVCSFVLLLGLVSLIVCLWRSRWCAAGRKGAKKHQMAREGDFIDDSDEVEMHRLARDMSTISVDPLEHS